MESQLFILLQCPVLIHPHYLHQFLVLSLEGSPLAVPPCTLRASLAFYRMQYQRYNRLVVQQNNLLLDQLAYHLLPHPIHQAAIQQHPLQDFQPRNHRYIQQANLCLHPLLIHQEYRHPFQLPNLHIYQLISRQIIQPQIQVEIPLQCHPINHRANQLIIQLHNHQAIHLQYQV